MWIYIQKICFVFIWVSSNANVRVFVSDWFTNSASELKFSLRVLPGRKKMLFMLKILHVFSEVHLCQQLIAPFLCKTSQTRNRLHPIFSISRLTSSDFIVILNSYLWNGTKHEIFYLHFSWDVFKIKKVWMLNQYYICIRVGVQTCFQKHSDDNSYICHLFTSMHNKSIFKIERRLRLQRYVSTGLGDKVSPWSRVSKNFSDANTNVN